MLIPRLRNLDRLADRFDELGLTEAATSYRQRQVELAALLPR